METTLREAINASGDFCGILLPVFRHLAIFPKV
jgi:hypothetical protein